ncbi:hypothetical membrane protein [Corynebacterium renale]|uniref:Uncharacterized protein DUF1707 n=2 Tax=Corynebacterium renale TaxID=1724 RepID=A0A2A9DMN3_9CORY|nr:uncharacterized protein DUF1707 [Corynebacterium renale]SQG63416.1 hypothetical membrane protein [Corynebacterium renale]SQI21990.1 hypothetical membrane protein [Corynebacterium renale]STD00007.1 hypothetical membrane protein [Corynebacterium renale]
MLGRMYDPNVRLSDQERSAALDALAASLGNGRLTMDEFDRRCTAVARAEYQGQLGALFADLPRTDEPTFTASELQVAHQQGKKTRAGVFGLSTIAALTIGALIGDEALIIAFAVVAALAILLYVMKIGPDSWYTPSPAKLARQRAKLAQVEKRAQRRDQWNEITNQAYNVAKGALEKRKWHDGGHV